MTPLDLICALADHSDVAIVLTDAVVEPPGPKIVYANEAFARLVGRPLRDFLGTSPRFMQGRQTRRPTLDKFRQALLAGERFRGFLVNYRGDGTRYEVEIDCRALRSFDGRIEHFLSFEREVVRRRGRPAPGVAGRYEPVSVSNASLEAGFRQLGIFT